MTTALPLTDPTPSVSYPRIDALLSVLAMPVGAARHRALYLLLEDLTADGSVYLSSWDGPLLELLRPRADLDEVSTRDRLMRSRRYIARDLIQAFNGALMSAPHTLLALAAAAPNPVYGLERMPLSATVTRRLIIAGCEADEIAVRRLTYAVADALRSALVHVTA